jgi:hypothetical protein
VTGDRRKLHNEELHNVYSSPNISKVINKTGDSRNAYGANEKCVQCFGWKA